MRILNYEEFKLEKAQLIESVIKGAVFIYPTDTIYGIGCNALNSKAVMKIRELKDRFSNPFSVITPSKKWIYDHLVISKEAKKWIRKLPGPYTLILKMKTRCVAENINPKLSSLGVRIPKHWISQLAAESNVPIVTTSVNKSGQGFMTSLEDLDSSIKRGVEFAIYEGLKEGKPSKIVDLTAKAKVTERV